MKDYSMDLEDSKTFILNYKIKEDKIIIKFANRKKLIVPYSLENEQKILEKMRNQVLQSDEIKQNQSNKFLTFFNGLIIDFVMTVLFIGAVSGLARLGVYISTFVYAMGDIPLFLAINNFCKVLRVKGTINDLNKNRKFVDNEEKINDHLASNPDILLNATKTTRLVCSTEEKTPALTINTVDKMSNRDLAQLLEAIDIQEQFEFDGFNPETSVSEESGPKKRFYPKNQNKIF